MLTPAGVVRRVYESLPDEAKRPVRLVPFGWRIGAEYRRTLAILRESDRWSAEALRAYQTLELNRLLIRALRHVPYWRERYGQLVGGDPWEVLERIEPIDKRTVQADPERFIDPTVPARATYLTSTGGTSGQPLEIHLDKRGFQVEWAFMVAQWERAGYREGMTKATFRGQSFPDDRLWQENPVYDELQFSPFAMNRHTLPLYVERLRTWRPDFLYGYPSALTQLARWVQAHPERRPPRVRALLCGSENIQVGQRELLERVFGARMFSWYGMSEKVILAGECETSTRYHAFPQYGVTEILDSQGRVRRDPGAEGELVGTGFMNTSMPFIRYRTGDFSSIVAGGCEACGRHHPLLGPVRGRWVQEMIVGRGDERISLTALNMHGEVFRGVERFQFIQRERGRATLQVVAGDGFTPDAVGRIRTALRLKTGSAVEWTVERVDDIALSPRGKGVFLVQMLPDV